MVQQEFVPKYNIVYGPDANCTLALCPVEASVYEYRPSLGGNITFLLLFAIALFLHTFLAIRWRTFSFGFCMFWGCVTEIIGYGGRLLLWQNPFSFAGFLMQISESFDISEMLETAINESTVCIALGPAFFSAAIYFTLSKMYISLPQSTRANNLPEEIPRSPFSSSYYQRPPS